MINEFKTIPGFPDYSINRAGNVKSLITGQFVGVYKHQGKWVAELIVDGRRKVKGIHILVFNTFSPIKSYKGHVTHFDGDINNNHIDNLVPRKISYMMITMSSEERKAYLYNLAKWAIVNPFS